MTVSFFVFFLLNLLLREGYAYDSQGLIYTESEQEVINEFQSVIESYVSEMFSSFVTGTKDIDEYWDTYLSELNAMGLEKYLETVQSAWTRMNG